MLDVNHIIGRSQNIFDNDVKRFETEICEIVQSSSFLVIGAAGSIGQSVTKEIFKRNPKLLHAIDLSENNLVELVRDLRSSIGYGSGEFASFAIDCSSEEFNSLISQNAAYDYVFNLSALKHVRSEKDPFTLMRLIKTNILNTVETLRRTKKLGTKKYFCVSTDKATNPVNMMGASKRIMELFLNRESEHQDVSMARFANVAFSDGSLLHGFNQRLAKMQPITAPSDVQRYFLNFQEAGELCLLSGLFGDNREIYFPKLSADLDMLTFSEIAIRFLNSHGYEPLLCGSEEEARARSLEMKSDRIWPCYFFQSDTTGEKDREEFYTGSERINFSSYDGIGIISNPLDYDDELLDNFVNEISRFRQRNWWTNQELIELFERLVPEFNHKNTGKFLEQRM